MSDEQTLGDEPDQPDSDAEQALDDGDELDEREREALNAAITRSLEQEARGEVSPVSEILARLRARRHEADLDRASGAEAEAREQPCAASDAEHAAFMAAGEAGLADIEAGRVHTHEEVREAMAARFGGPDRATLTDVTDEVCRILDAALELPERERVQLAAILTDSIGDGSSPEEVRASWLAEVKRRREALERGEETLVDFDDMMARLRAKVHRSRERRASTG